MQECQGRCDRFDCQLTVVSQHSTHAHERPHDEDTDLNGTLGLEHAGNHYGAMLGKRIGQIMPPAPLI